MLIFLTKDAIASDELIRKGVKEYRRLYGIAETDYEIIRDGDKKPCLSPPLLEFNLSHSGEYTALAVSEQPVGIDIQRHKPCDYESVSQRFFGCAEGPASAEDFFDMWARKEAGAKHGGIPLAEALREADKEGSAACGLLNGYSLAIHSDDKEILFIFLYK